MPILDSMGVQYSIVDADEDGISTSALSRVLANWDSSQGPFPKVLYTVPVRLIDFLHRLHFLTLYSSSLGLIPLASQQATADASKSCG